MSKGSGGGGNGGRSGDGRNPINIIDRKLSVLNAERDQLYKLKDTLWETKKGRLSDAQSTRLEKINPKINTLEQMKRGYQKGTPKLARQSNQESIRARNLRNANYSRTKATAAQKARQWREDHPL